MTRHESEDFDVILTLVGRASVGLTLRDLLHELGDRWPRRTLQRRIASLVSANRLTRGGQGRAARYRLSEAPAGAGDAVPPTTAAHPVDDGTLRLASTEGARLAALVRAPLARRTPVGYQRAFLDDYVPDVTTYLSPTLRAKLHALGRSPSTERPAGTYARDVLARLLIDLSWASSTLEGNTYTRLDTQNLIELGLLAEGKGQREAQMILNHKAAIEMLVEDADTIGFNRFTFENLHALLSDGLLTDAAASGRLRVIPVEIAGTVFVPLAIPQQLEEYFDRLLAKADAITDPFEQAFFVMVHLPYLQPFEDVNKRVSRLAANIPFIKRNLSPLSFVDVPEPRTSTAPSRSTSSTASTSSAMSSSGPTSDRACATSPSRTACPSPIRSGSATGKR